MPKRNGSFSVWAVVTLRSKGQRVQKVSLGRRILRQWMVIVAVVVVAVAGFAVYRLHGIFGSNHKTSTSSAFADEIQPFNPKHIVLEVFGPAGTVATVNYLDINAQPQRANDVTLPWRYDTTTTQPAVFVNVMAQGDSDSLGCRILIDDVIKDERVVNTMNAYVYCLDKSG